MLPMTTLHGSWLFRLVGCFLILGFSAPPIPAFWIPIHGHITSDALDRYSEAQIAKWERVQMKRGCEAADMVEGDLPVFKGPYEKRFHFDNDFTFQLLISNFVDVVNLIDTNLAKPEKDPWEFGKAMHAIEDLYSHSNYVELFREWMAANGDSLVGTIPTFEEVILQPGRYREFVLLLKDKLHTGRYPNERRYYPKETDHGWPVGPGMNKDLLQRTLYEDARQTAVNAVAWYLKVYLKDPVALQQWKQLAAAQIAGSFGLRAASIPVPVSSSATNADKGQPAVRPIQNKKDSTSKQRKAPQDKPIADLITSKPETKKAAIEALVRRGDAGRDLAIARFVQDADPEVASEACWALGELRDKQTSSQAVLGLQQHLDPRVRGTCAIAVGRIGDPQSTVALNTAAMNEKEDIQVRLAAIQALAMTDSEHATSLPSLLGNSDPRIRASAAYSASQLQSPSAVELIKAMLASADPQTKAYGLQDAGIWPEQFVVELAKIAADSNVAMESRLFGLAAMDALPKAQKEAVYAKLISPLVEPSYAPEIQVAAAQILSEVPAARPELERVAEDGRQSPQLLERLNELKIPAAAPVSPATHPVVEHQGANWLEGLVGSIVGGVLVLFGVFVRDWFHQRAESKVDRKRKEILMEMLTDDRFKEQWRELKTLMQVIGADRETTTRLLVELGARGSEKGDDLWGLKEKHPFKKLSRG
jgi:HEAT repeat protein